MSFPPPINPTSLVAVGSTSEGGVLDKETQEQRRDPSRKLQAVEVDTDVSVLGAVGGVFAISQSADLSYRSCQSALADDIWSMYTQQGSQSSSTPRRLETKTSMRYGKPILPIHQPKTVTKPSGSVSSSSEISQLYTGQATKGEGSKLSPSMILDAKPKYGRPQVQSKRPLIKSDTFMPLAPALPTPLTSLPKTMPVKPEGTQYDAHVFPSTRVDSRLLRTEGLYDLKRLSLYEIANASYYSELEACCLGIIDEDSGATSQQCTDVILPIATSPPVIFAPRALNIWQQRHGDQHVALTCLTILLELPKEEQDYNIAQHLICVGAKVMDQFSDIARNSISGKDKKDLRRLLFKILSDKLVTNPGSRLPAAGKSLLVNLVTSNLFNSRLTAIEKSDNQSQLEWSQLCDALNKIKNIKIDGICNQMVNYFISNCDLTQSKYNLCSCTDLVTGVKAILKNSDIGGNDDMPSTSLPIQLSKLVNTNQDALMALAFLNNTSIEELNIFTKSMPKTAFDVPRISRFLLEIDKTVQSSCIDVIGNFLIWYQGQHQLTHLTCANSKDKKKKLESHVQCIKHIQASRLSPIIYIQNVDSGPETQAPFLMGTHKYGKARVSVTRSSEEGYLCHILENKASSLSRLMPIGGIVHEKQQVPLCSSTPLTLSQMRALMACLSRILQPSNSEQRSTQIPAVFSPDDPKMAAFICFLMLMIKVPITVSFKELILSLFKSYESKVVAWIDISMLAQLAIEQGRPLS